MRSIKMRAARQLAVPVTAVFVLLGTTGVASAQAKKLTVDDVVNIVLAQNPRMVAARLRTNGAHDTADSARGKLLPVVRLTEEYQHYDSPFIIGLQGGVSLQARDQDTNTFIAGVEQPILGLFARSHDYQAETRSADAADAGLRAAEASARKGLTIEFLRMFEAQAMEDIAKASEAELAEQVTVTEAKVKAGSLMTSDLLRIQVAKANARQQGIQQHANAEVSRARLLVSIGLTPDDRTVEFVEPTALLRASGGSASAARSVAAEGPLRLALHQRPELAQRTAEAESQQHHADSSYFGLFPNVDLEAAYMRLDGQPFAAKNAGFVGVKASWPIWEWGASYYAQRAAAVKAEAAKLDIEEQKGIVLVEVTESRAGLEATSSAVELAEQTIASAQEAFRVTGVQVQAGTATTTDLLDSEAALTQARLNLAHARYEQAIAKVGLDYATGTLTGRPAAPR